jgi:hypothetical protein
VAPGRRNGRYLFIDRTDAEAFADSVGASDVTLAVDVEGTISITRAEAEVLITRERVAALEDIRRPAVARELHDGVDLKAIAARLRETPEIADAAALIGRWIEVDHARTARPDAYTVVGHYGEGPVPV